MATARHARIQGLGFPKLPNVLVAATCNVVRANDDACSSALFGMLIQYSKVVSPDISRIAAGYISSSYVPLEWRTTGKPRRVGFEILLPWADDAFNLTGFHTSYDHF